MVDENEILEDLENLLYYVKSLEDQAINVDLLPEVEAAIMGIMDKYSGIKEWT